MEHGRYPNEREREREREERERGGRRAVSLIINNE